MKKRLNLKNFTVITLTASFLLSPSVACALPANETISGDTRRAAYLRQDVTVELNREKLSFTDEQGAVVYLLHITAVHICLFVRYRGLWESR